MGQHSKIRFNVILKYWVVEKFWVVLCTTGRNCQRGPMLRKDKIFGLILTISIVGTNFDIDIYRYRFLLDISDTGGNADWNHSPSYGRLACKPEGLTATLWRQFQKIFCRWDNFMYLLPCKFHKFFGQELTDFMAILIILTLKTICCSKVVYKFNFSIVSRYTLSELYFVGTHSYFHILILFRAKEYKEYPFNIEYWANIKLRK